MAETTADLGDRVSSWMPVSQRVISLPKRLRYPLHHRVDPVNRALRVFLADVEAALRSRPPDAPNGVRR